MVVFVVPKVYCVALWYLAQLGVAVVQAKQHTTEKRTIDFVDKSVWYRLFVVTIAASGPRPTSLGLVL